VSCPGRRSTPFRASSADSSKCLYLTTRSLDPTGKGKARWGTRWALNAFPVTFEGRIQKMITDQIRSTVYLIDPRGDMGLPICS
jgi:hypothetical protein